MNWSGECSEISHKSLQVTVLDAVDGRAELRALVAIQRPADRGDEDK
jgi:hypothetical protein